MNQVAFLAVEFGEDAGDFIRGERFGFPGIDGQVLDPVQRVAVDDFIRVEVEIDLAQRYQNVVLALVADLQAGEPVFDLGHAQVIDDTIAKRGDQVMVNGALIVAESAGLTVGLNAL